MTEYKSWLTKNYTPNSYESDIDTDLAISRRRKALEEVQNLLRKKYIQQIDFPLD